MATPARLVVLECPKCRATECIFHNDHTGLPGGDNRLACGDRAGGFCSKCGCETGLRVKEQAPPEFFLQPHPLYPMNAKDFDYWVAILREHFPDHPKLGTLGTTWFPPERPRLIARLKSWLRWW